MSKLSDVILYFLSRRNLGRTEIVKYLYMFELYYQAHTGSSGLDVRFIRYHHGPYAFEIADELRELERSGKVRERQYINAYGNIAYSYTVVTADIPELEPVAKEIADLVISTLGGLTFKGMLKRVYETTPMLSVLEAEEEQQTLLEGTELDMSSPRGTFKRTPEGRRAAKERLRNLQPRGSDEDYFMTLIQEQKLLERLRRRALSVTEDSRS